MLTNQAMLDAALSHYKDYKGTRAVALQKMRAAFIPVELHTDAERAVVLAAASTVLNGIDGEPLFDVAIVDIRIQIATALLVYEGWQLHLLSLPKDDRPTCDVNKAVGLYFSKLPVEIAGLAVRNRGPQEGQDNFFQELIRSITKNPDWMKTIYSIWRWFDSDKHSTERM